ncbi:hypothetical protein RRB45_04230, partial [Streptococcus pneumoniae]|nr:hypothetical protein [Streptococcus pneumoniae]
TLKNAWTTSRQVNFFWVANFNLKFGFCKKFLSPAPHHAKKPPDWVASLGDCDEKSLGFY